MENPADKMLLYARNGVSMPETGLTVTVLQALATHGLDAFNSMGRLLITSKEGGAGKSTALRIFSVFCNQPSKVNKTTTEWGILAKFREREVPTLIIDEASIIFGKDGTKESKPNLSTALRIGYSRADATDAVARQKNGVDETYTVFGGAAIAGLRKAVPDDMYSRMIEIKMRPMGRRELTLDMDDPGVLADGKLLGDAGHQYIRAELGKLKDIAKSLRVPHDSFRGRLRQIWLPLFAVAELLGGEWPHRCYRAFQDLALDSSEQKVLTSDEMIVLDTAAAFAARGTDRLLCADIADYLWNESENSVHWSQHQLPSLGRKLTAAFGIPGKITVADGRRSSGFYARHVEAAAAALRDELYGTGVPEIKMDPYEEMFSVGTESTESTEIPETSLRVPAAPARKAPPVVPAAVTNPPAPPEEARSAPGRPVLPERIPLRTVLPDAFRRK